MDEHAPDVIVCHPACASSLCSWVELGHERAAESPDVTAEVLGPRTWTSGRDEIARVLAGVDETKGTHP
jgi:hypothetical protein